MLTNISPEKIIDAKNRLEKCQDNVSRHVRKLFKENEKDASLFLLLIQLLDTFAFRNLARMIQVSLLYNGIKNDINWRTQSKEEITAHLSSLEDPKTASVVIDACLHHISC